MTARSIENGSLLPENTRMDIVYSDDSMLSRVFICFVYALIVCLSLVGNSVVIYVVVRCRSMWSITNLFITNLAFSDLIMSCFAALFTPIAFYTDTWVLPHFFCQLLGFTMGVSVYVSTLTSTAIAVDRYLVIVHPFFPKMKRWLCFTIITIIWLVSVQICLPLAIYQQIEIENVNNATVCVEAWPQNASRKVFTVLSFVFQFVVPSIVITFCYFYVHKLLWIRRNQKLGSRFRSAQKEEIENRRNRKTNTMLIAMVIVFVVCWIPLNGLWILVDVFGVHAFANFQTIFIAFHIIAMSSAVYNPFLYAWLNENFKENFRAVFSCVFRPRNVETQQPKASKAVTVVPRLQINDHNASSSQLDDLPKLCQESCKLCPDAD